MKLRLVSRLMVVALVVVVGLIIILHQHAVAGSSPSTPAATSTPTSLAEWPSQVPGWLSWYSLTWRGCPAGEMALDLPL